MNANRRFNSIARRIHGAWQWKKLWVTLLVDAAALLACAAAYLYVRETEVTGAFAGLSIARGFTAQEGLSNLDWVRSLCYTFTWEGVVHVVPLQPFLNLAWVFGRPLLIAEGVLWLLGFLGGARSARRLLKPLDRMAETAQRLSEAAAARPRVDEAKFHDLEDALERIDIGDRLSTGDKDLQGLEEAINSMLARMHAAYRQQAQFVSDASHELRTPIAVIQGYVRMLDRWGKDDERCWRSPSPPSRPRPST